MLNNQFEESFQLAQQTLELALSIADHKSISLTYIAEGKAQYKLLSFEEALNSFEKAYEISFHYSYFQASIESLFHCGNCHYKLGQFHLAKRYYERVIDKSHSAKTGIEIYYQARLYLGSTLYYLGDIQQSNQMHKHLYYELHYYSYPFIKIDAVLGLAWSSHQLGNTPLAMSLSNQIRELSLQNGSYNLDRIETNYGVFLCKMGSSENVFDLWNKAFATFESNDDRIAQATVKEEIALQFLKLENIDLAESSLLEALILLGLADEIYFRGRIYRILGTVAEKRHDKQNALQWYRLALQCLHMTKSKVELYLTQTLIESLATLDFNHKTAEELPD